MNNSIELKRLSEQRSALMGIAILFVMITHNTLSVPSERVNTLNNAIKVLTQSGVDMFFFVSGMGCYNSLCNRKIGEYYKRRLTKILIPFFIVFCIYGVYSIAIVGNSFMKYIHLYGLYSFFTEGVLSEWFIAAILGTYLISPLLYSLLKKNKTLFICVIVGMYVFEIVVHCFIPILIIKNIFSDIWIARMPAFMVGMMTCKKIKENDKEISKNKAFIIMFLGLLCATLSCYIYSAKIVYYWMWIRFLFLPMICGLFVAYLFFIRKSGIIDRWLSLLGTITLEIYLVHEKLLIILNRLIVHFSTSETIGLLIINVISVVLAIVLAKSLQMLSNMILGKTNEKAINI